jgi:protein NrfC
MTGKAHRHTDRKLTVSRRDFLRYSGMTIIGSALLGFSFDASGEEKATWGFLLLDPKKCQGCSSCMLACSLVHEGVTSFSRSRIQVVQNSFGKWPDDLTVSQCRQCVTPACVAACPTGALHRDPFHGDVATVNRLKCIGCKQCVNACPYAPSKAIWNAEEGHSQKCDLCAAAPYWQEKSGPNGKKACLEICPVKAIVFTTIIPDQSTDDGYIVNLRDTVWGSLGFPTT